MAKLKKYKNCIIEEKTFTTMVYMYRAECRGVIMMADTIIGIKKLINQRIELLK